MTTEQPRPSLESVLLALGYAAGGLSQAAIFTALAEALQDRRVQPERIAFLRDALTRALQLGGVEPLSPT